MAAYLAAEQLNSDGEPNVHTKTRPVKTLINSKRPRSTRHKNTVPVSNTDLDIAQDNDTGSGADSDFIETTSVGESSDSDGSEICEIEPQNAEASIYLLFVGPSLLTCLY